MGTVIDGVISIVATGSGTVVYYDHWEDGYELDVTNPAQSSTQIWGDGIAANGNAASALVCGVACAGDIINGGNVIVLRNNVGLPRNSGTILYDGKDKVSSTQAVAVTRAEWAVDPGPVLSGAVEVLPVAKYGTTYEMPIGQNLASNQMFEHVALFVMAGSDNTSCTFRGSGFNLSAGQNYYTADGVNTGDRLVCDKPVQAHLITGDVGSRYESRWFTLVPYAQWGSSYFAPVGTTSTSDPADVWIYNPSDSSTIAVTVETLSGSSSVNVGANSAVRVEMPSNSGARLFSAGGAPFFAIGTVDSDQNGSANQSHDWGYSLVPERNLTQMAVVGWGPGSSDDSENGSPVWVMASRATTVYVDYDGQDGTCPSTINGRCYDIALPLAYLQSRTIYDPSGDNNQTGMRLFTVDGTLITGVWGQDPSVARPGNPFLDMGTTVLPFPQVQLVKEWALLIDAGSDGNVTPFVDTLVYTITLKNSGVVPAANIVISDSLSAELYYVNDSTVVDGSPQADDLSGATRFPLDEGGLTVAGLDVEESAVFVYRATAGNVSSVTNTAVARSSLFDLTAQVDTPVDQGAITACTLDFISGLGGPSASYYQANGTVYVRLTDGDQNTTGGQEVVTATLYNPSITDRETVSLTETAGSSGIFEGSLPSSTTGGQGVADGTLYAQVGQTLSVSFTDTVYGDSCTDTTPPAITAPSQTKVLYLSADGSGSPDQDLDRIDPVATGDPTTSTSTVLSIGSSPGSAQYLYAMRGANTSEFWRYDLTSGSWATSLATPPDTIGLGSGMTFAIDDIYLLQGRQLNGFYRYDISGDSWTTLANFPGTPDKAGALVYDGGNYIYTFDGGTIQFYRYDITANTWLQLADYYDKFDAGGSLISDGTYVYALQGKGSNRFERYDPTSNSWTTMAAAPGNISTGGALTFDGSYIYALQGAGTGFYRYSIADNSWTTLANSPLTVGAEGALTFDRTSIYAFFGASAAFRRYDIASNTWSSLADAPAVVGGGSDLVVDVAAVSALGDVTTLTLNGVSQDTWLNMDASSFNYGNSTELKVDREASKLERALVQFDISSIPSNAVIIAATLKLTKLAGNSDINIAVHQMSSTWDEGSGGNGGAAGDASWDERSPGIVWSSAGGDFGPAVDTINVSGNGIYGWNVKSIVQSWVDAKGANNFGFMLESPDGGGNRDQTFAGSENGTPAHRPSLSVTYAISTTQGSASTAFTQTLPMAADFNMPEGGLLTVATHISLTNTVTNSTVVSTISQGSDDAEEGAVGSSNAGRTYVDSSDIEIVYDNNGGSNNGNQIVGLRFNSITVPKNATITNAYLTFHGISADSGNDNSSSATLTISGQAADNPDTFIAGSSNSDISTRTPTSASEPWSPPTSWTAGVKYDSPDLSSIVQELVNRDGWTSGNSIVFIITGTGSRSTESYENGGGNPIKLTVEYQAHTPGSLTANPTITATLKHNGTTITNLTNPVYSHGILTWTGTLSGDVTVPAGDQFALEIVSAETDPFQIRYDSSSYPSKIGLPTTTVISVDSLAVYDAAYPGGSPIGGGFNGQTVYVRATVSDPFGAADIISATLNLSGTTVILTDTFVVASTSGSKTYEYAWSTPAGPGTYNISLTAHEGYEGISDSAGTPLVLSFQDLGTPGVIEFIDTSGNLVSSYDPAQEVCV